ncbi:roadblock/LC7 domain-containing protein [Streptomyces sp. NBC_01619]|uniref:roadblock/LC7 domain-containing protein n=1 Tax=Streptomyces sp. NBC_01619 TaxID=2975901 RepID=UPI00224E4381|nr:roadblock/LC7 domain-containing protein [Streptomyces sp. NBC_01619]MCX4515793.1 roadblock/LC7 domain-containing protein [Streptomyces sp. NBC_01619]
MKNELSWILDTVLEIPGALHAVLVSADGLVIAHTKDLAKDNADVTAASVSGMQSLSRANGFFIDGKREGSTLQWRQTVVEFDGGWIFSIAAGPGSYLAVAATPDVNMADITFRMQRLVGQLGEKLSAPPREIGRHR